MRFAIVAVALIAAFIVLLVQTTERPIDLAADRAAAHAIIDGVSPQQPSEQFAPTYGAEGSDRIFPRTPGALLTIMPLAAIPEGGVRIAGIVLIIAALVVTAFLLDAVYGVRWWRSVAFLPLFFLTVAGAGEAVTANVSVIIPPLILASFLMARSGDRWLAGVPVGVAVTLRLWPWILPVAWFLTGRRKMAYGAAGGFLALNLIGFALPGVSLSGSIEAMRSGTLWISYGDNGSLPSMLGSWSVIPLQLIVVGIVAYFAGRFEWHTASVAILPVALFLAPILWPHYLIAGVIPLVWAWQRGSRVPFLALAMSLLWIAGISAGMTTSLTILVSISAVIHAMSVDARERGQAAISDR